MREKSPAFSPVPPQHPPCEFKCESQLLSVCWACTRSKPLGLWNVFRGVDAAEVIQGWIAVSWKGLVLTYSIFFFIAQCSFHCKRSSHFRNMSLFLDFTASISGESWTSVARCKDEVCPAFLGRAAGGSGILAPPMHAHQGRDPATCEVKTCFTSKRQ